MEVLSPTPFKYHGMSLAQIPITEDAVIISITRSGELLIPRGNTLLCEGDKVLCVARDAAMHQLAADWGIAEK